ncbi:MAG: hypothetical protein ACPGCP_01230 [Candidatus Nanopelagicales bacterium]
MKVRKAKSKERPSAVTSLAEARKVLHEAEVSFQLAQSRASLSIAIVAAVIAVMASIFVWQAQSRQSDVAAYESAVADFAALASRVAEADAACARESSSNLVTLEASKVLAENALKSKDPGRRVVRLLTSPRFAMLNEDCDQFHALAAEATVSYPMLPEPPRVKADLVDRFGLGIALILGALTLWAFNQALKGAASRLVGARLNYEELLAEADALKAAERARDQASAAIHPPSPRPMSGGVRALLEKIAALFWRQSV